MFVPVQSACPTWDVGQHLSVRNRVPPDERDHHMVCSTCLTMDRLHRFKRTTPAESVPNSVEILEHSVLLRDGAYGGQVIVLLNLSYIQLHMFFACFYQF